MRRGKKGFYKREVSEGGHVYYRPLYPITPFLHADYETPMDVLRKQFAAYGSISKAIGERLKTVDPHRKYAADAADVVYSAILAGLKYSYGMQEWERSHYPERTMENAWCAMPLNAMLWLAMLDYDAEVADEIFENTRDFLIDRCLRLAKMEGSFKAHHLPCSKNISRLATGVKGGDRNAVNILSIQELLTAYSLLLTPKPDASHSELIHRAMGVDEIQKEAQSLVLSLVSLFRPLGSHMGKLMFPPKTVELGTSGVVPARQVTALVTPDANNFTRVFIMAACPVYAATNMLTSLVYNAWGTKATQHTGWPLDKVVTHAVTPIVRTINNDRPESILLGAKFVGFGYLW